MEKKGERIRVGIAGEHYAAAELSRRGWVVMVTSKNTPYVDIIGRREATKEFVAIQVKSRASYPYAWRVTDPGPSTSRGFFVFVDLIKAQPNYWIVPSAVVGSNIKSQQIRTADLKPYKNAWHLLDESS